jgi:hypothetical protein
VVQTAGETDRDGKHSEAHKNTKSNPKVTQNTKPHPQKKHQKKEKGADSMSLSVLLARTATAERESAMDGQTDTRQALGEEDIFTARASAIV